MLSCVNPAIRTSVANFTTGKPKERNAGAEAK